MTGTILCQWDGEAFIPISSRWVKLANDRYVVGESYDLNIYEDRSAASHRHYFAMIREIWLNLPEELALRFPTETHLRKFALIKCGYHDERSVVCGSRAEALRISAFIKPLDTFAVVTVSEKVVTVYTAKSQSRSAQGNVAFQESKTRVLDCLASMIGVDVGTLQKSAGMAA